MTDLPNARADSVQARRSPRRVRVRTVLLITNLLVVALPLLGVGVLRLYENELVRRTEAELYGQGAFVSGAYLEALRRAFIDAGDSLDEAVRDGRYGVAAEARFLETDDPDHVLRPFEAELDRFRDPILPPALDDDELPAATADALAASAGERMAPILEYGRVITLAGVRLVDAHGVEVASTGGIHHQDLHGWSEVPRALRGETVSTLRLRESDEPPPAITSLSRRTRVRVFVAMPVLVDDRVVGVVVLSRTPISLRRALYDGRWTLAVMALVLALAAAGLGLFTSRLLTRPITALMRQAEAVSKSHTADAPRVARPGTAEVARLSEAIEEMARALRQREAYIREFATGVSHELKTPLTSIKGAAELLGDHLGEMSDAERAQFLAVIAAEADRLEQLVRRLLELARAEVVAPAGVTSDASEVAARVAQTWRGQTADVALGDMTPDVWVTMDEALVETVVRGLVDNALQHGGPRTAVRIDLSTRGAHAMLTVRDSGAGVSEANEHRIFDRFFTTARDEGGTGLGLAILQTLCRQHGGDLVYRRADGWTCFEVLLPVAPPLTPDL